MNHFACLPALFTLYPFVICMQNVHISNKDGIEEKMDGEGGIYIRSGIVVVSKGATVPDNTII